MGSDVKRYRCNCDGEYREENECADIGDCGDSVCSYSGQANYQEEPSSTSSSPVDSPPHYTTGKIECIDAIEAALGAEGFAAYCHGQIIKYVWRHKHKGKPVEDLAKAQWYRERLLLKYQQTPS